MSKLSNNYLQRGQALLIILLVLAASLTIVLSTASRTVTDVQTSGLEEDSLRAFNAAEVGIEEALIQQTQPSDETLDNDASYTVDYTVASPGASGFVHPAKFTSGDTATFWFVSQDTNGDLTCGGGQQCSRANSMRICWGNSGSLPPLEDRPAIEVSIYYDDSPGRLAVNSNNYSNVNIARAAYDPNAARTSSNNFTAAGSCPGGNIAGKSFPYGATVLFNPANLNISCSNSNPRGCLLMARVKFLYNNIAEPVGIRLFGASSSLPPQGAEIESTGVAGDSTRRISVYQSYPEIPSFFDSAVFSRGSITK